MKKAILLILITVLSLAAEVAKADFTFGEPTNLGAFVNSSARDFGPSCSADGLSLYFDSDRPGGSGDQDLWGTRRSTTKDLWGKPANLGSIVNSSYADNSPGISADGLLLFFGSNRPGGFGEMDIWAAKRPTTNDPWGDPVNLGPPINTSYNETDVCISADGSELYFSSDRPGGSGGADLWVARRSTVEDGWSMPVNLGPTLNTSFDDGGPNISTDGLCLFFEFYGAVDNFDIWMSKRPNKEHPWCIPVNLGLPINSSARDLQPEISFDGSTLYFTSDCPGGFGDHDLWQASIEPVVDLNGDGIVDSADMCIIVEHWGTDESLCDIGPTPLGDGIVDVQDLIVLAERLFEEIPEQPQVTTVVIVRHAERANGTLTADGEKRAETLARLLSNTGVSAVFSTNYTRTIETANNTAERLGITIQFYNSIQGIADLIKSEYAGKVVLVVGHSNTVPQTIEALGVSSAPTIYGEYDNLFIVTIRPDGIASLTHLKYDIHLDL
ncbi:MAG: PD40 domain-containing protein [Planctomycetota bacterium]|nr:MAG: PD40 domain-containing protein [Planctomycetota bacterium]